MGIGSPYKVYLGSTIGYGVTDTDCHLQNNNYQFHSLIHNHNILHKNCNLIKDQGKRKTLFPEVYMYF